MGVGAHGADHAQPGCAGLFGTARHGQDSVEVDGAKSRLATRDLDGRAQRDEDVVEVVDAVQRRQTAKVDDVMGQLAVLDRRCAPATLCTAR